jgi:hypothetical protein
MDQDEFYDADDDGGNNNFNDIGNDNYDNGYGGYDDQQTDVIEKRGLFGDKTEVIQSDNYDNGYGGYDDQQT